MTSFLLWHVRMLLACSLFCHWQIQALQPADLSRSTKSSSQLAGTQWKLQLDVGLQPGTWMPKRFPGWGKSGARLGLGVQVEFSNTPCSTAEDLVGPLVETYQLRVVSPPSTFVSAKGQQTVEFTNGGWCIQRPTGSVRNAAGNSVQPEGLLRFWLDCPTGATRQDVEIPSGTRMFFTTGVWDNLAVVEQQESEYEQSMAELQALIETTQENKANSKTQNLLQQFNTFREMVGDSKMYDALKAKCETLGQQLPPLGSPKSKDGSVMLAPNGSLVIKGKSSGWMPTSEYLILGTFTTAAATAVSDN